MENEVKRKRGRPAGSQLSEEAKAKISASCAATWAERKRLAEIGQMVEAAMARKGEG